MSGGSSTYFRYARFTSVHAGSFNAACESHSPLGFSDRVFGLGAGIFFVSYVALQIPGALLIERWSARRCITSILITWGSLTVLTGLVHTASQLYGARLLLGAAEAAFFPASLCT